MMTLIAIAIFILRQCSISNAFLSICNKGSNHALYLVVREYLYTLGITVIQSIRKIVMQIKTVFTYCEWGYF